MTDTSKPAMTRLYGSTPFDPTDRQDQLGEAARKLLLDAALRGKEMGLVQSGEDMPYLLGGLLIGIVQIAQAIAGASDETDAAIRVSIMQIAPWAVDMARSAQGKPPLSTDLSARTSGTGGRDD